MTRQITELAELRETLNGWRKAGQTIALVPTMGALHAGHMALVQAAKQQAQHVVVSIFVNPTQFGPNEDLARYPRSLTEDVAMLQAAGADIAWLPSVETMYPDGVRSNIHVKEVGDTLEGVLRPGHFDGVATVVTRLFEQVRPDIAVFGEKDYQQLCLIRRLVNDFVIDVSILGVETLREPDDLAMSSRNRYLSEQERKIAPLLYAVMNETAKRIVAGQPVSKVLHEGRQRLLMLGFSKVDYLELRKEETLAEMVTLQSTARLLAAAWLGKTRLIDNMRVG